MNRFHERSAVFTQHRPDSASMTAQEQATFCAAREILSRHFNRNPVLSSWAAVMDYCACLSARDVEHFHVLYLDRKNRLISDERMAVGTVDHVPVYPREVVRRALALNASALLRVHNHPSGDPEPSASDLAMTKEIRKACEVLGLILLDHIIVGAGREVSLRGRGDL